MRCARRSDSRVMMPAYSRPAPSPLCFPVASSSANMRISDSGVFSSCETLAMKSLFSCDARRSARIDSQTTPRPTAMITVDTGISSTPSSRSVSACARSSSTLSGVT